MANEKPTLPIAEVSTLESTTTDTEPITTEPPTNTLLPGFRLFLIEKLHFKSLL